MKTTKETMKILGVGSRTTLQKMCDAKGVTPSKDENGWNCYTDDDIEKLKEYIHNVNTQINPLPTPEFQREITSYDAIHDALDCLREMGMQVVLDIDPTKRNHRYEMTTKTRKQRELLYDTYLEYQDAYYNKRKELLNMLDKTFA